MAYTITTERFEGRLQTFTICVPQAAELQDAYQRAKTAPTPMEFPYWGKIWPSAKALAGYLDANPGLVAGKTVLELAGGLGLPAMVASQYAAGVTGSDHQPEALALLEKSVALNSITNMHTQLLDWRQLPQPIHHDVVLLSDINYEPNLFDELYQLVAGLRDDGVLLLLASPQRLLAKPFFELLLPLSQKHETLLIDGETISLVTL